MREARLIGTAEVPVAGVDDRQRLRPVDPAALVALLASIRELGRITDPIHVRRVSPDKLVLIAGGHRLAAARELGWAGIPAHVRDCTADWAKLLEIDDNLAHGDLCPLDLSVFMAERKRVCLKLHPETAKGVSGALSRWDKRATDIVSVASSIAKQKQMSDRNVRRVISAGERLTEAEIVLLRGAPRPPTLKDLQDIARIGEPADRLAAIRLFADGEAPAIARARKRADQKTPAPRDPVDVAAERLSDLFRRAPMRAKRRFVAGEAAMLRRLLADRDAAEVDA